MDLFEDPKPGSNAPEFSVSDITGAVKKTLEGAFGRVRVRGEVGRVFRARSGHLYYDLKDDKNVISCTTWKGQVAGLGMEPEEGLEIIVTGRLTSSGLQSKYQINVDQIEVAGQGALLAMLEKRKAQLASEGLFAEERKKPLPYLPEVIGVVTSPSGAVIRDILHRLRDRFPRKVLIWPVAVQGANCAPEVTRAITGFNALTPGGALPRPDLLIVARGGGSVEDLWGFNEESVARAAAASDIPLISAVGHETDTTLIDFVSDRRAPTPTAAAEMAVPVRLDLLAWVDEQGARLRRSSATGLEMRRQRLRDLARALPRPDALTSEARQRLDLWDQRLASALTRPLRTKEVQLAKVASGLTPASMSARLARAEEGLAATSRRLGPALARNAQASRNEFTRLAKRHQPEPLMRAISTKDREMNSLSSSLSQISRTQIEKWQSSLAALDRVRETLGYRATLARGYAVVRGDGDLVTTAKAARSAASLEIEFADGRVTPGGAAKAKAAKPKGDPNNQGSLF